MAHHHAHAGCDHHPVPTDFGRTFLIAASLNALFIVAEIIYGLRAHSLSLLADAGHNFSDVLGLLLAWAAWFLSKRKPSSRYTYGLRSTSILAALVNAVLLLVAIGGIAWEAVQRFYVTSEPVAGGIVMGVAGFGIVINGITAWMFSKGQHDLNVRAAFLHLLSDALVSAGVVVAGFIIGRTGWVWLDPAVSLAICAVIVWGTWGLLRDSLNLALHAVPTGIDMADIRAFLLNLPGVTHIHDLHVWGMSTTENALSAHLLLPNGHPGDAFLNSLSDRLQHDFKIHHTTIQIEIGDSAETCKQAPDEVV